MWLASGVVTVVASYGCFFPPPASVQEVGEGMTSAAREISGSDAVEVVEVTRTGASGDWTLLVVPPSGGRMDASVGQAGSTLRERLEGRPWCGKAPQCLLLVTDDVVDVAALDPDVIEVPQQFALSGSGPGYVKMRLVRVTGQSGTGVRLVEVSTGRPD